MKILHILRAPIGGLFRHVCDLAAVQANDSHDVGIICDNAGGGDQTRQALADIEHLCVLGIHRIAMPRLPGPGDLAPLRAIRRIAHASKPQILHGHGAKGGLYARLLARDAGSKALYTPHGGALHYSWMTPHGAIFLGAEKLLLGRTDGMAFVCQFERHEFARKIGLRNVPASVVHNGLWPDEFKPVQVRPDATDLLFVGELRTLKGVDVLIDAVAHVNRDQPVSLTIVGAGPDKQSFVNQVKRLNLTDKVQFAGVLPARDAFCRGRIIVIPSRAESFPYILLEAIAAGMPVIATRVGGIAEVLSQDMLVKANDPKGLGLAIENALKDPEKLAATAINEAKQAVKQLNVHEMGRKIVRFYGTL